MMLKKNILGRGLIILMVVVALGWGGFSLWMQLLHRPGPLKTSLRLVFDQGAHTTYIAKTLEEAGVVESATTFRLAARASLSDRIFKAGEYTFTPGISVRAVMKKLAGGDVLQRQITIPEGLTVQEIRRLIISTQGLKGPPLEFEEGALLPETYDYRWGDKRTELMRRMADAMTQAVQEAWDARIPGLPLSSPYELLTLASIVEKETSLAQERPLVAGVFINRLRQRMRLQSDPTVIYGASDLKDRLRNKHLREDQPYNTYVHRGLPPTPISNPGRAALFAVANPAETKALFFVINGEGGHVFSETYAVHQQHVAAMLKRNKKANAQKSK